METTKSTMDSQISKKSGSINNKLKYPDQHQKLLEMGFDTKSINEALDSTNGDLNAATAVLLGEPAPTISSQSKPVAPMRVVGKQASQTPKPVVKVDIKEAHNKFMATYKVTKCKDKSNHDKRMCFYWHTKGDRRRNPFDVLYTCTECPNSSETVNCDNGDNCLKAHNMLERMFHPELFKISMCQRGPNGSHCERGNLCAFAHSEEDHRIPTSHTKTVPSTVVASTSTATQMATTAVSTETIQPGKSMSDSRLLDTIQERLVKLIKNQGSEGIISSELPKRFSDAYSERLELTDEAGEKFRIKDLLLSHPHISVTMHKGVQPKYVYEEVEPLSSVAPPAVVVPLTTAPIPVSVPTVKPPNPVLLGSTPATTGISYSAIANSAAIKAAASRVATSASLTSGTSSYPPLSQQHNTIDYASVVAPPGSPTTIRRRGPSATIEQQAHSLIGSNKINNEINLLNTLQQQSILQQALNSNNIGNNTFIDPSRPSAQDPVYNQWQSSNNNVATSSHMNINITPPSSSLLFDVSGVGTTTSNSTSGKCSPDKYDALDAAVENFAMGSPFTAMMAAAAATAPGNATTASAVIGGGSTRRRGPDSIGSLIAAVTTTTTASAASVVTNAEDNTSISNTIGSSSASAAGRSSSRIDTITPPPTVQQSFHSTASSINSAASSNGSNNTTSRLNISEFSLNTPSSSSSSGSSSSSTVPPGLPTAVAATVAMGNSSSSGAAATGDKQHHPGAATMVEFHERLSQANSTNDKLSQQVHALQGELTKRSLEMEAQGTQLKGVIQQLSEAEDKQNKAVNAKDSALSDMYRARMELDDLKAKSMGRDSEVNMKLSEIRQRDFIIAQLKSEKLSDLNMFCHNLSQIENFLVDMQRKEAMYINEISLHDTINESSRARDELTKFVNMLKIQLSNRLTNENNNNINNSFGSSNNSGIGNLNNILNMPNPSATTSTASATTANNSNVGVTTSGVSGMTINTSSSSSNSNEKAETFGSPLRSAVFAAQQQQQQQSTFLPMPMLPNGNGFLGGASNNDMHLLRSSTNNNNNNTNNSINNNNINNSMTDDDDTYRLISSATTSSVLNSSTSSTSSSSSILSGTSGSRGMNTSGNNNNSSSSNNSTGSSGNNTTASHNRLLVCGLPGCHAEGTYICSACNRTGYCGVDHQREHWVLHMTECKGGH